LLSEHEHKGRRQIRYFQPACVVSRDGKYRDGRGGGANTGELLIMQLSKLRTVDGYTACRLKQFKCSKLSNIEGILQKYCEGTNWN